MSIKDFNIGDKITWKASTPVGKNPDSYTGVVKEIKDPMVVVDWNDGIKGNLGVHWRSIELLCE